MSEELGPVATFEIGCATVEDMIRLPMPQTEKGRAYARQQLEAVESSLFEVIGTAKLFDEQEVVTRAEPLLERLRARIREFGE